MAKYKIEKGRKLPEALPPNNRKYPFNEMEVDEMFYVDITEGKRIRSAAHMHGKRTGTKFATRTLVDGKVTRICVMRVQ